MTILRSLNPFTRSQARTRTVEASGWLVSTTRRPSLPSWRETDRRLVFLDQVAENSGEDGTATGNTTSTSAPANYAGAQLIFLLGNQARRVLIARCRPPRKPPLPKTPLANPCNPTPRLPQWSETTHSLGPN